MQYFNFIGSTNIQFGRKIGSKDKKKRKALIHIGAGTVAGAAGGAAYTKWITSKVNKQAVIGGALLGGTLTGIHSLGKYLGDKYAPNYKRNLLIRKLGAGLVNKLKNRDK